jgi:mannosyl-oligosaccharide alpha-1,2-mannosidase
VTRIRLELIHVTDGESSNGWAATAVDGLSTAIVMGEADIVNEILQYIPSINFGVSYQDSAVSLFETTIRYLAGLLSAYDLLTGPSSGLANSTDNVNQLLEQAKNLANNLSYAFDTPTGIPNNNLILSNRGNDGATTNGLATIGTLVLEWTRLSDITGNDTYGQLAQKGESYLLNPQPTSSEPWPGLVGTNVDIATGQFQDADGGWNGGDDSFYEYLIKMYVYDSSRFGQYRTRWELAADSSIQHLATHPDSRTDLTYLAQFSGQTLDEESGHLACFDGGNFILGGLVLKNQTYVDFGLQLVAACENLYNQVISPILQESLIVRFG